jgi:hypothetical protein
MRSSFRALLWPGLAFVVTVVAAVLVVTAQPLRSPWWMYADADGAYAGSALNLLRGSPIRYLDHPGLPLEELLAVAFGADAHARSVPRATYTTSRMLNLDQVRPIYRGFGVAFYLLGAVLFTLLPMRLFGDWLPGLAGGLLWLAAPGLTWMSIMYRPDVPLAVLCLIFAYLVGRAAMQRSAGTYLAAGVVAGFTMMVKLHAAGLLVPLAIAILWRAPADGWARNLVERARLRLRPFTEPRPLGRRHGLSLLVGAGVLAVGGVAFLMNEHRAPFRIASADLLGVVALFALVAVFAAVTITVGTRARSRLRHVLDPFNAAVAGSVLLGLTMPAVFDVPDWFAAVRRIEDGLVGRGVNSGLQPFGGHVSLTAAPLRYAAAVFALAAAAAIVGLSKREPLPVIWFTGAAVLAGMAFGRQGLVYYFAPAFVLSVPAALWLLRFLRTRPLRIAALALVVLLVIPPFLDRGGLQADLRRANAAMAQPTNRIVLAQLRPKEVALTAFYWPAADPRYYDEVQSYVAYTPPYPYRLLPLRAADWAIANGYRPRFYVGSEVAAGVTHLGGYTLQKLPDAPFAARLVAGPGVGKP